MSKFTRKEAATVLLSASDIPNTKTLYLRLFAYAWKYKTVFLGGLLGLVVLSATASVAV